MEFIKTNQKKEILEKLKEEFGIEALPYLLIKIRENEFRGYTGSLSKDEISKLNTEVRIDKIGIPLFEIQEEGIKLEFDSLTILKPTKNIIELTDKQTEDWLRGKDIEIMLEKKEKFIVLKNKGNFLGCGRYSNNRISNSVPRERRIKS